MGSPFNKVVSPFASSSSLKMPSTTGNTAVFPNPGGGYKNPNPGSGAGSYNNRRDRYDARCDKRWGNWSPYLEIAAPLLWLDAIYAASLAEDAGPLWPEVVDIWP